MRVFISFNRTFNGKTRTAVWEEDGEERRAKEILEILFNKINANITSNLHEDCDKIGDESKEGGGGVRKNQNLMNDNHTKWTSSYFF